MKKTIVAMAVFGLFGSLAQAYAQSNVTIYGVLDVGYVKESGRDLRQADDDNNRMGFRGSEDLGGGWKAIFDLQKRFDLNDGTKGNVNTAGFRGTKSANQRTYEGAAWVGLASPYGKFRLGRINSIETENIRKFDPFNQISVGSQIYGLQRSARISNTLRYDSPQFNNLTVSASYSLGANTNKDSISAAARGLKNAHADNDGYELGLLYDNGSLSANANIARVADSKNSRLWSVGLGYRLTDTLKALLSYEDNDSHGYMGGGATFDGGEAYGYADWRDARQRNLLAGLEWKVGPGTLNTSVQWDRLSNGKALGGWTGTKDSYKYSLGYTYDLSKRTSLYGVVAYTDYKDEQAGFVVSGLEKDSVVGTQVGITHRF